MSEQMNSGLTAVGGTIDVTGQVAMGLPAGATQIIKSVSSDNTSHTVTVYTVPADTVLYITSAWTACLAQHSAATYARVTIEVDDGTGTYISLVESTAFVPAANFNGAGSCANQFSPPIKVLAGDLVRSVNVIGAGANSFGSYGFTGYTLPV